MICLVALFTFSVLGIFSAKYRSLAREAFKCVFLRLTLRPCDTKLDERIRSKLTSKLLRRSPKLARVFYKHFEIISWAFTILFFSSMIYSSYSLYNLYVHGTCDPYSDDCPLSLTAPVCGCEGICKCDEVVCESPDYEACQGDCSCQQELCSQS